VRKSYDSCKRAHPIENRDGSESASHSSEGDGDVAMRFRNHDCRNRHCSNELNKMVIAAESR